MPPASTSTSCSSFTALPQICPENRGSSLKSLPVLLWAYGNGSTTGEERNSSKRFPVRQGDVEQAFQCPTALPAFQLVQLHCPHVEVDSQFRAEITGMN